jgi:hypothetical protein
MKVIEITSPKFGVHKVLVDDEDYPKLSKYNWHLDVTPYTVYAIRTVYLDGKKKAIKMHRDILNVTDPKVHVDHKDRDGLNNMKINIRKSTHGENSKNRRSAANSTSKYLGVNKHTYIRRGKVYVYWDASLSSDGKVRLNKGFKSEIEAAKAYDEAAKKYHGEFANLNFK